MKPRSLFIMSFILFTAFMWFAMSTMDYDRSKQFATAAAYGTAGWFILGFPCIALLATGYAAFFALIGRTIHHACGWVGMLLVTIPLIMSAAYSGLPKNRLAAIIGPEAAKIARLERLQTSDSFGDGSTAAGILTGPDHLLSLIVRQRSLAPEAQSPLSLFQFLADEVLPEKGDVFRNGSMVFFRDADGTIYFRCRRG